MNIVKINNKKKCEINIPSNSGIIIITNGPRDWHHGPAGIFTVFSLQGKLLYDRGHLPTQCRYLCEETICTIFFNSNEFDAKVEFGKREF